MKYMLKILIFNILDKKPLANQLVNKPEIKRTESLIFPQTSKNSHLLSSPFISLSAPILIPYSLPPSLHPQPGCILYTR
jgi:hypothetical protein